MTNVTIGKPLARNYTRACVQCSTSFEGYSKRAQYCSPDCRKAYRSGYMKRYHAARPGYQEERSQAYYRANSEAIRARSRAWYHANTARAAEARRAYVAANPERVRGWRMDWANANKEAMRTSQRAYKSRQTPEYFANEYHKRKARKASNGVYVVTARDMRRCLERHRNACAYCSISFTDDNRPTWDHVVAISRGGPHSVGNLVPACMACNTSKWASTITEWRARLA